MGDALREILETFSDPRLFESFIHYFDVLNEYSKDKVVKSNRIYALEDFDGKKINKALNSIPYLQKLHKQNIHFFNSVLDRFVRKYKGHIYDPEGLYSEQIFGPVFDYQCQCGYITGEVNKDKVCPICGVKCASSKERYRTIGFIELQIPVINPLFMFAINKIVTISSLNRLTQSKDEPHQSFSQFMLFDLTKKKFVVPEEIPFEHLPKMYLELQTFNGTPKQYLDFIIEKLLYDGIIDNDTVEKIKLKYHREVIVFGWYSLIKSIFHDDILSIFLSVNQNLFTIYPQILKNLFLLLVPVTSPETRPIIILDGQRIIPQITKILQSLILLSSAGRISDIFEDLDEKEEENDSPHDYVQYAKNPLLYLYNHFSSIAETESVSEISHKELISSRLQFQVKKYYASIIDEIKGKEGRIRSELIGKTIDFSARNVITPTLEIKPYEILISYHTAKKVLLPEFINFIYILSKRILDRIKPNEINPVLYKKDIQPFDDKDKNEKLKQIFRIYTKDGYSIKDLQTGEKKFGITYLDIIQILYEILYGVSKESLLSPEVKEIIDTLFDFFIHNINKDVIEIKALINRQPTLWIYSIIGYMVKVNTNKDDFTLKIHPLIVESFNADFDGDSFKGKIDLLVEYNNKQVELKNIDIEQLKDLDIE